MSFWGKAADVFKTVAPIFGPIGGVASTIIDAASQRHANTANAQQAKEQMQFQERMRDTQHQSAVKDMEAAGLNPALAYSGGGNAAPSGTMSTQEAETRGTATGLTAAIAAYNEFANANAQRDLLRAQTSASTQAARQAQVNADIGMPQALLQLDPRYRKAYADTAFAKLAGEKFTADKTSETWSNLLRVQNANITNAQQAAEEARSRTILNEQQMQAAFYRKYIGPWVNSGAHAGRGLRDFISPFAPKY